MPVKKSAIFGFCLFDFANSAYTTVIITAVYSVYFARSLGSPFLWSMTLSLSYFLVILVSPVSGAIADLGGFKKRFLFFSYTICVASTALLYFGTPEKAWLAVALIILSNFGFSLSENFVSSFLPSLADRSNMGRVSGYAWSFGYVGGVASLILSLVFLIQAKFADEAMRTVPVLTAGFFALFALPAFFWLREPALQGPRPSLGIGLVRTGFRRLRETFNAVRVYRDLFRFLTAFFFYSCGTVTVISFAAIFAEQVLRFKTAEIIKLIFTANITAAVGAFMFGFIQDMIGAKKTLYITLVLWLLAAVAAYFVEGRTLFWIIANIVGFAMGASQSASRSLVGILSPPGKIAEFYGFWGFAGKGAAIAGLFSFGLFLKAFGGMRPAILTTAAFFLIGIVLLRFVNEPPLPKKKEPWEDL